MQVDDSLGVGTESFLEKEEIASKQFRCKPRTIISSENTSFNGINIKKTTASYSITQSDKVDKLVDPTTSVEYASHRALAQYVGVNTRPDICAPVQLLAPGSGKSIEKGKIKGLVTWILSDVAC